jgi:predicted DNA-binding transcriptional regulator AlpA
MTTLKFDSTDRAEAPRFGTAPIFWRLSKLLGSLDKSKSFIYAGIKAGTFPQPVKLGRASVWVASEVESWAAARVAERTN